MEEAPSLVVDNTMGAALIGVIFAGILYGGNTIAFLNPHHLNGLEQYLAYKPGSTSTNTPKTSGRLYSNSVLATLNARQSIRELGEDNDELSFSFRMRPMFSKTFENVFSAKPQQLNSNVSLFDFFA
ncbi:hypothetical protein C0993_002795 [Termitomyces sp. T159_Od127]|nr:hypothetical protein C0993_002795 [Termitomyces sp. T159_Od127]